MAIPLPPDSKRCTGMTKRGARCKAWALVDDPDQRCQAHSTDPSRQSLVIRDPVAAQARSAAAQKRKRDDAEHREYLRSLGLREQVRARIEDRATEIVDRLMELAKSPDPQVSLRAIDALWNRSYGRPVTPVVTADATPTNPLVETFAQLSPEERRALLQQAVRAQPQQSQLPQLEAGDS